MNEAHRNRTIEMMEVMQAYLDGRKVEYFSIDDNWVEATTPNWGRFTFRIKPTEPDSINWDHVGLDWNYMARDEDGDVWLFEELPVRGGYGWAGNGCNSVMAEGFASYKRGDGDWKDSLAKRPR